MNNIHKVLLEQVSLSLLFAGKCPSQSEQMIDSFGNLESFFSSIRPTCTPDQIMAAIALFVKNNKSW
jgi:hypothetical protein